MVEVSSHNKIVVLDPGLEGRSGHHYALYEAAQKRVGSDLGNVEIKFYARKNSAGEFDFFEDIFVAEHFDSKLYQFYQSRPTVGEAHRYTSQLAEEYYRAMLCEVVVNESIGERRVTFLYPAVKWEHLAAIGIAISELESFDKKNIEIKHKICLMYNPGIDFDGNLFSVEEFLGYRIAAKYLSIREDVFFYVSDYELSVQYKDVFQRKLKIHPCYLFDFSSISKRSMSFSAGGERKIGLYHGDAKREKGFLELPRALESILPQLSTEDRIYIQYTLNNSDLSLNNTADKIKHIAENDQRVVLVDEFLSGESLMCQISELSEYIFLYDSAHYENKSSGIAWLVGYFKCPSTTIGSSWISRELKRLGVPLRVAPSVASISLTENLHQSFIKKEDYELRSIMYDDFWFGVGMLAERN